MTDVTIVMTTYLPPDVGAVRLAAEKQAVTSWRERLRYSGGAVHLHVADDGSPGYPGDFDWVSDLWDRGEVTMSQGHRHGVGSSLNRGCDEAFDRATVGAMFVDDWLLTEPFDITPWVDLLMRDESVCMVRFFPHPDLTGRVEHLGDLGHALRLDRHHFAFATRPALYHARMFEAYGKFAEDANAYSVEQLYNEHFCATPGPDIVLALPSPWLPIAESPELAHIEPRDG